MFYLKKNINFNRLPQKKPTDMPHDTKTRDFRVVLENPFPPYQNVLDQIAHLLLREKILGVLFIDCTELRWVERFYGRQVYVNIMDHFMQAANSLPGAVTRYEDITTSNYPNQDQFFIFLSPKREDHKFYANDLDEMAKRVKKHINAELKKESLGLLTGKTLIHVGFATVLYNSMYDVERHIHIVIEDSKKMLEFLKFRTKVKNKEKLKELVLKEAITTVYQPIVELKDLSTIGFEALTRGPKGTEYESPYLLFEVARDLDMGFELDSLCRKFAFLNAKEMDKNYRIFVNCQPSSIADPEFKGGYLRKFLQDLNIPPKNIVLEINEREAIANYDIFEKSLAYYLNLGFSVALDDTGAGYSSFEAILKLKPNYIKIDMGIIRDIQDDKIKQQIVKSIVAINDVIHAVVIAEGIETIEEYQVVKELGVTHGQGFLFARPGGAFPNVDTKRLMSLIKKKP